MSELFLSSQQQMVNALRQLQQPAAAGAPLLRQATEVLVSHLAGNQLQLNLSPRAARAGNNPPAPLVVSSSGLTGVLTGGQSYQLVQDPDNSSRLHFYPDTSRQINQGPQQTALVPKALADILMPRLLESSRLPSSALTLDATVISQNAQRLVLQVADSRLNVVLPTPPASFSTGQKLELAYQPDARQWQLRPLQGSATQAIRVEIPPQALSPATLLLPRNQPLALPVEGLRHNLQQIPLPSANALAQKISGPLSSVQLLVTGKGQIQLQYQQAAPQASLDLGKAEAAKLQTWLPRADGQPSGRQEATLPVGRQAPLPVAGDPGISTDKSGPLQGRDSRTAVAPVQQPPDRALSGQPLSSTQTAAAKADLNSALYKQLIELTRHLQSQQEPAPALLGRIELALGESDRLAPAMASLVGQIGKQISQGLPGGNEQDAQMLRQLFTHPPMTMNPVQLTTPAASQGFIGGLITLLQVSLASRLASQQNRTAAQVQRLSEGLTSLLEGSRSTSAQPAPMRGLTDFAQVEQRHQLIRNLGRLLAQHTSQKAASADAQIQGQDSFHYSLPVGSAENRREMELLIRREPPPGDKRRPGQDADRQWHLSMKLDIGQTGSLLAKARLFHNELELDFYAANDEVKNRVLEFLPHLKKRLVSLGLQVNHSQCQLGKIPDQLQQRPYHIFETRA
ncbi:flagellar hook-length control protein FliK [Bowmanella dokdonensis]|uniref:Flagellar hook-length control protein FliK n=1 Tax=Bowmanella dokdonensis TaxID=751969 RepID=A0A939DQZ6_9ALTE|nr:flagellar hook-length control protein FliK [Bowmanella dokdonensis]MBN7826326.1 flagellar hook-length control protein FliK [Bowmanella dokdonensis]